MKPSMAIKPLVFAIAAIMAVAAQAGQNDRRGHDHHGGDRTPPAKMVPINATANATDRQSSTDNRILNEGTINNAEMSSSATGTSGNVGVNVASGSGNQQDNAAAIANAASDASAIDNSFVFGTASATARVNQTSSSNRVDNYGTTASGIMSGSGNAGSGNMGINVAGGDLNQQKNTMAIANANAGLGNSTATASANQSGPGLTVNNRADRTYRQDTLSFTTTSSGSADYAKASASHEDQSASSAWAANGSNSWDASGSKSSASYGAREAESHATGSATLAASLNASYDASRNSSVTDGRREHSRSESADGSLTASLNASLDTSKDKTSSSSWSKGSGSNFEKAYNSSYEKAGASASQSSKDANKAYAESSSYDLSNTVSFQVLTPTGWANPVTNTATLSGSVNGGSGNLGVNVAAGVGNQQSNSLAISNTSF